MIAPELIGIDRLKRAESSLESKLIDFEKLQNNLLSKLSNLFSEFWSNEKPSYKELGLSTLLGVTLLGAMFFYGPLLDMVKTKSISGVAIIVIVPCAIVPGGIILALFSDIRKKFSIILQILLVLPLVILWAITTALMPLIFALFGLSLSIGSIGMIIIPITLEISQLL